MSKTCPEFKPFGTSYRALGGTHSRSAVTGYVCETWVNPAIIWVNLLSLFRLISSKRGVSKSISLSCICTIKKINKSILLMRECVFKI